MKPERKRKNKSELFLVLLALTAFLALPLFSQEITAQPTGLDITYNESETRDANAPSERTDIGGTITTMQVEVAQQIITWKAYVGNITGTLALDDAGGNSIYRWELDVGDVTGNIFITRDSAVDWTDINCSTTQNMEDEDANLGLDSSTSYSINGTFSSNTYSSITVNLEAKNNCPATSTFINGDPQGVAPNDADFPLILLTSNTNLIYATPIKKETESFRGSGDLVDFQAIVPNQAGQSTAYYFYAELS